jgi:hypothetical protein
VERFIGYLAHNFLPRVAGPQATTVADLNDAVQQWLTEIDDRQLGGIRQTRKERFAEEKPFMHPWIPEAAPDVRQSVDLVVSRDGLVSWQTNRYSVPADIIGEIVTLKIDTATSEADIVHNGTVVRSMTLMPPRSHDIDRREEDLRSLRQRWKRENESGTSESDAGVSDDETKVLHALLATMVEIRHPEAYDHIAEHSA